jgi:gamma-glutamylcyclotransferase (GGCT)/AIG2-like uncharacterized protein YtfP
MLESGSSDAWVQLFVYGTLRPPRGDVPRADCRFYSDIASYVVRRELAKLPDALLYDLGTYPGARPGPGTVVGDLLRVRPEALAVTDRIEGHPRFFVRQRAAVHSEDGMVTAWVYWAPEAMCADQPRIPGGDWFARQSLSGR